MIVACKIADEVSPRFILLRIEVFAAFSEKNKIGSRSCWT
jgi:hypothetical protein